MKRGGADDGVFFAVIGILYVLAFAGVIGWQLGRRELRREQRIDRLQADVWKLSDPRIAELESRPRARGGMLPEAELREPAPSPAPVEATAAA